MDGVSLPADLTQREVRLCADYLTKYFRIWFAFAEIFAFAKISAALLARLCQTWQCHWLRCVRLCNVIGSAVSDLAISLDPLCQT